MPPALVRTGFLDTVILPAREALSADARPTESLLHRWIQAKKRRAVVEHVIGEMKTWTLLRCRRRRGDGVDLAAKSVVVLWNLRIEMADR